MNNELKELIKNSERYKDFCLLDKPIPFKEMFSNKDFNVVQLHSTQIMTYKDNSKYIGGFCGVFKWENNKIISLDGDSYCDYFKVLGYSEFKNEKEGISSGIDILVGNDW